MASELPAPGVVMRLFGRILYITKVYVQDRHVAIYYELESRRIADNGVEPH